MQLLKHCNCIKGQRRRPSFAISGTIYVAIQSNDDGVNRKVKGKTTDWLKSEVGN